MMVVLPINNKVKKTAWNFLKNNNIANRGRADGNKGEQYVGLLGETIVKQYLGIDTKFSNGFDGGYDLKYNGIKVDVKTMGRMVNPKPYYVNNFIAYQSDFKCDAYIFCSINKKTSELTICGWVTKDELLERANLYEKGTIRTRTDGSTFELKAPTYEIQNDRLNSIETF